MTMYNLEVHFAILVLSSLCTTGNSKGPLVYCDIDWNPSGFGNVPVGSLPCSNGIDEYVVRVLTAGGFAAGHLIARSGIAIAVFNDDVLEFDTYRTLVVPTYCDISWRQPEAGENLTNAVMIDSSPDIGYVARGKTSMQSYCGTYIIDTLAKIPTDEKVVINRSPELLFSTYPPLVATLTNIVFKTSHVSESLAKAEIIGQEKFDITNTLQIISGVHINHSKGFVERFSFYEDNLDWKGIDKITLEVPMPFGISDLEESTVVQQKDKSIRFSNKRILEVSGYFSIQDFDETTTLQACSIAYILDGVDIEFEADLVFQSDRVPAVHIQKILTQLGRLNSVVDDEDKVLVPTSGVLRGRYLYNKAFYFEPMDWTSFCSKYQ